MQPSPLSHDDDDNDAVVDHHHRLTTMSDRGPTPRQRKPPPPNNSNNARSMLLFHRSVSTPSDLSSSASASVEQHHPNLPFRIAAHGDGKAGSSGGLYSNGGATAAVLGKRDHGFAITAAANNTTTTTTTTTTTSLHWCRKRNVLPGLAFFMLISRILYHVIWVHRHNGAFSLQQVLQQQSSSLYTNGAARILDAPSSWPTASANGVSSTKAHVLRLATPRHGPSSMMMMTSHHHHHQVETVAIVPRLDPWNMVDKSSILEARRLLYQERYQRTKPPPYYSSSTGTNGTMTTTAFHLEESSSSSSLARDIESSWTVQTLNAVPMEEINWSKLCTDAKLDRKSRVVVTHLFSVDPGPALAFLLHKHCQVQEVAGVDPLMPNLRFLRMTALKQYKQLYRTIEKFHFVVPTAAAGFGKRGEKFELEWLTLFRPTHIIHLEEQGAASSSSSNDNNNTQQQQQRFAEFIKSEAHWRLYQQQHSALGLDQLRTYVEQKQQQQQNGDDKKKKDVAFLHVLVGGRSSSTDNNGAAASLMMTKRRLEIPYGYGPYTMTKEYRPGAVFVDSAVAAILHCLGSSTSSSGDTSSKDKEQQDTNRRLRWVVPPPQEKPRDTRDFDKALAAPYVNESAAVLTRYREAYGVYSNRLPCASSCGANAACTVSVWDPIILLTQKATEQCLYVVYVVDFDANLRALNKPAKKDQPLLCRLAFVAEQSPLAQNIIQRGGENGKMVVDHWTLFWLPKDDTTLSNAELSLIQLEPTRFLHHKIRKAMYAGASSYAEPPDASILNILVRLDHQAMPRHFVKEYRSGTKLSRFVERLAEPARSVAFFGSEPSVPLRNVNDYQKLAEQDPMIKLSRRQVAYYKQTSHWIQMDMNRPDMEMRNTMYAPFPFKWVSMGLIIHDLQVDAARTFRCQWLDENLYWGSRGADELSLAYVIAERRIEGVLGLDVDNDWIPLQVTGQPLSGRDKFELFVPPRVVTAAPNSAEVFLRILKPHGSY